MIDRIKLAWQILLGKKYAGPKVETRYVVDQKPPNQFIQLVNWRDDILALDAEGKIWQIQSHYNGVLNHYQVMMESPRRH